MAWPFPDKTADPEAKPGEAKAEKTPAELIAESLQSALKPLAERFDTITQRMDVIEQNTKKPEPKVENPNIPSVLDDEEAAFNMRMSPVFARTLELEARVVKNDIKAEYRSAGFGELLQQYEAEIDQTIDNSPLVDGQNKLVRGDANYIRNVIDMIFGRAARKAGMRFDGKNKSFFLESAGGSAATQQVAAETEGMTADQIRVFQRMGVPLSEAKKSIAKLKFVQ